MEAAAAKAAFEALKSDFQAERFPMIAGRMAGQSLAWGRALLDHYRKADRDRLMEIDSLGRFWVLRYRGMTEPADLAGATPGAGFVLAFTAFPYLDVMMDVWTLGQAVDTAPDRIVFGILFDGEDQGSRVVAEKSATGWQFDLMDLYRDKAKALDAFVDAQYGGDFDDFLAAYVAEHDLDFNTARAWRPLS